MAGYLALHDLRIPAEVRESKRFRSRGFASKLRELPQGALTMCHRRHTGDRALDPEGLTAVRAVVPRRVTEHLQELRLRDPNIQRLLDGLDWHHVRGNLLHFPFEFPVEPVNSRAGLSLWSAVIAQRVSQCKKNTAGAETFGTFASMVKTLAQLFHADKMPDPAPAR